MLTSGQNPAPSFGRNIASSPPSAPPIISSGASTPPDVPEPSDTAQINHFTSSTPRITLRRHVALQQAADRVVTHAQRLRKHQTRPSPIANPPIAGHHIQ